MDEKYLKLAREARQEENCDDAKKYYEMVRVDDPENGEAKFFYTYYCIYQGTNGELPQRFVNLCNVLEASIKKISESSESNEEKLKVVDDIANAFVPYTWNTYNFMYKIYMTHEIFSCNEFHAVIMSEITGCYVLGDVIEMYFNSNNDFLKIAAKSWKEGIALQQKRYIAFSSGYYDDATALDRYASKIQKVDPSYVIPTKEPKQDCLQSSNKK